MGIQGNFVSEMQLKEIVDELLKGENRSLSWLAGELDMTFDGLKLSLLKGSLKYNDLKRLAVILKIEPYRLFTSRHRAESGLVGEDAPAYYSLRTELATCRELVDTLKSQIKDKDKIIDLLSKL